VASSTVNAGAKADAWLTSCSMPLESLATRQVLAWSLLAISSV